VAQTIKCLPSNLEALSSNPNTSQKKKKKLLAVCGGLMAGLGDMSLSSQLLGEAQLLRGAELLLKGTRFPCEMIKM
jgi:hypothetical protein